MATNVIEVHTHESKVIIPDPDMHYIILAREINYINMYYIIIDFS